MLERTLELKLKHANIEASPQKIRNSLKSMQFAEIKADQSKFLIKTKQGALGSKILRQLAIKEPPNIMPIITT